MDVYAKRPIAMVSENLAREMWGTPAAALGKRIRESMKSTWREVIGVVSDEREDGVDHEAPAIAIFPTLMDDFEGNRPFVRRTLAYVVRSSRTGSQGFLKDIQKVVWSVNPNLPLADVRTLQSIYEKSMARTSFTLVMLAIAGGMALLIGLVGIYGVISYSVSQRTRENVYRYLYGTALDTISPPTNTGPASGSPGPLTLISSNVMLLQPNNGYFSPVVLPKSAGAWPLGKGKTSISAVLASYIPAMGATRVDPVEALRAE